MSDLKRTMYTAAGISLGLMFVFFILMQNTGRQLFCTLGIIAMMTAYHLIIRLFIGSIAGKVPLKEFDPSSARFRERSFEKRLYGLLRVKKWKDYAPTYDISEFSTVYHTFGELARTTCRAETTHWLCVLASLVSICFTAWLGALPAFLITAVLGALVDMAFIVIQRYNRPRLLRLAERREYDY